MLSMVPPVECDSHPLRSRSSVTHHQATGPFWSLCPCWPTVPRRALNRHRQMLIKTRDMVRNPFIITKRLFVQGGDCSQFWLVYLLKTSSAGRSNFNTAQEQYTIIKIKDGGRRGHNTSKEKYIFYSFLD